MKPAALAVVLVLLVVFSPVLVAAVWPALIAAACLWLAVAVIWVRS